MTIPLESDDMAFALVARLRGHGHLCNVLTHIGSGNWRAIERAIASILRPRTRASDLGAIARNIVQLIADGRGVTGPIMRSVFFDAVGGEAGVGQAKRAKRKIARLRDGMRSERRRQAKQAVEQPPPDSANGKQQPAAAAHERTAWSDAA